MKLCGLVLVVVVLLLVGRWGPVSGASGGEDRAGGPQVKRQAECGCNRSEHGHGHGVVTEVPIVSFKWVHVELPYLVALWVLVAGLGKLVIEANHHVTSIIPESALLICFGFILGGMIWGADKVQTFSLTPTVFFLYLLPQVILDAGYSMPNKLFFSNMGGILVYAIIGTCWNAASLGLSLWGCHQGGAMGDLDIGLLQYLLFGSLIAAVDPVAVIAVFEQVHVNEVLFIMVFGESLLNDGVTVVLFNVFDSFVSLGGSKINAVEIIKGIISFFVVAFGGSLLGFVFGLLISLLTRCTKNIQIIEPGFIFILGYLSYLTAEMLSLSAILSILFCGMCCQKYISANMAESSVQTVRYMMKVLANGSETIIFVFLGISAVDRNLWVWNTGFILLTLLFIFVYRLIGVFFLTWILNKFRLVPISYIDQGERRGSLEFVRNDTAFVDFKKKFGDEFSEAMPDIMADMSDDHGARRDPVPSISLEMHEQNMNGLRGAEDINTHHLLQQHLYKGRKQHRHRYSRSHFDVNRDEDEVQEIFQRTMRNRLESFKSAKMGVAPPKTISKHTKKEQQQKMSNGKSGDKDFGFLGADGASGYEASGGLFPMRVTYRAGAGIENPAFMADLDPSDPMQIPPWLAETEIDTSTVAPSQRAQVMLPWTPSNLRRLAPLRTSTRSTDSFMMVDAPQQRDGEELLPPPPPPPPPPRDADHL
ncbi:hypothetical protein INR49_009263 [Caranx melampygus]|nr:hypothetical protein INR49_009263 [Caranx melampygus]